MGRTPPSACSTPIRGRAIYYMPPGHTRTTLSSALDGSMSAQKALQECGVVAADNPQLVARISEHRQELERLERSRDRRGHRKARKKAIAELERLAIQHRHPEAASFNWTFR